MKFKVVVLLAISSLTYSLDKLMEGDTGWRSSNTVEFAEYSPQKQWLVIKGLVVRRCHELRRPTGRS